MAHDDLTDILNRFAAVWSSGNPDVAVAMYSEDARYDEMPAFSFQGREALRAFFADFFARHHEISFTIERSIYDPENNAVAVGWTFAHTRTADQRRVVYHGMSFVDFTPDGLITSWLGYSALAANP